MTDVIPLSDIGKIPAYFKRNHFSLHFYGYLKEKKC